jgi:cysteine synthase A
MTSGARSALLFTAAAAAAAAAVAAVQLARRHRRRPRPRPRAPSAVGADGAEEAARDAAAAAAAAARLCGCGPLGFTRAGLCGLVGCTPLVRLESVSAETGCTVLAKCEHLNPGGSPKDRVALELVLDAEERGELRAGGTVVEGTSGSTGISLAQVCRARGYRCVIVMPDDQAVEKRRLLELLGAEVVLVRPASIVNEGHYVNVARRLARETAGGFFANQFENEANWRAHRAQTGPELWTQTGGCVDAFVMSAGTGGTIAGVGRFLRGAWVAAQPQRQGRAPVAIVLADPQGSSLLHKVNDGVLFCPEQAERRLRRHRDDSIVEGVGIDRLTANFAQAVVDRALRVTDQEVVDMSRRLLCEEGLFCGSSSALNVAAARRVALELGPGHTVVTVLCGSGVREQSKLYNAEYLAGRGLHCAGEQSRMSST